jgi:hypothetical protein
LVNYLAGWKYPPETLGCDEAGKQSRPPQDEG